jgi:hypothetical protein
MNRSSYTRNTLAKYRKVIKAEIIGQGDFPNQ